MRDIKYIVIHCTATPQTATVASIKNYWKNTLKWKSVGYHKVINIDGSVETLASDSDVTNGVAGYNSNSLHISYIGGIDNNGKGKDTRTIEQKCALRHEIKMWKNKYPNAKILGHRDFPNVKKECPSFSVKDWLIEINF